MSAEKTKEVEKMIAKVEKKKDLTRAQAIDYMLGVATGRLAALWRYDESLPEGKKSKGILAEVGRKKRAPKATRVVVLPEKPEPKEKPAKEKPAKPAKKKPAKKRAKKAPEQIEIAPGSE